MRRFGPALIGAAVLLAGCSAPEGERLPGERLDIRAGMPGAETPSANLAAALALPAQRSNAAWTQRAGGPDHQIPHPALGASLAPLFTAPIGAGDSRRFRITADPVVAGGRIFTLDSQGLAVATSTAGARLWATDLTPASDSRGETSGGGVATDGARVYVTTGYGELSALDAATGQVIWTQELGAAGSAAPTIDNGMLYIVGRDSRGWAIEAVTGRVAWTLDSVPYGANFGGGSGAAVSGGTVVFPYPSGQVIAAATGFGLERWAASVAGDRPGRAAAVAATDISGDPVIDGGRVYAGNASGRLAALDLETGLTLWTATDGAVGPIIPAGGSLFFVSDIGQLVRLDAASGRPLWRVDLPVLKERRWPLGDLRFANYGPVLAGGRLIVPSSDGTLRQFDPVSGALLAEMPLPGGAASNPVVAGGVLYLMTGDGQLAAFR